MRITFSGRLAVLATTAALVSVLALGAQTAPAKSGAAAVAPDTVVMTVGTTHVTAAQFDALLAGLPAQVRSEAEAHKRAVAEQYAHILALDTAAEQQHLDREPQLRAQLRLARENALANALIAHLAAQARPSATAVTAYYQAHHADFEQVKVRHILITDNQSPNAQTQRTPAEAKALIDSIAAKLKAGQKFSALAAQYSDDTGSKDKGGELGYVSRGETVPAFDRIIWSLQPGQISAPFQSRFGYHIVQVEARRTMPLESVRAKIEKKLVTARLHQEVEAIAHAHPAHLNAGYFGPAPAPPASAH